jgi:hypothetical protein
MSILGFTSGRLDHDQARLDELSRALLLVNATMLGHQERLGFTPEQVAQAREQLAVFATQLVNALRDDRTAPPEVASVIQQIRVGGDVIEDWMEDLAQLPETLRSAQTLSENQIRVLRKALGYIRQHVAESLNRTRPRS